MTSDAIPQTKSKITMTLKHLCAMKVASYLDVQLRSFLVIPEGQNHCWRQKTRGRVLSVVTLVCFAPSHLQDIRIPVSLQRKKTAPFQKK